MKYIALAVVVASAALAQQHSTVPVVLVDDFDFANGCSATRSPETSFGNLYQILYQETGQYPYYFDYCKYGSSMEELASSSLLNSKVKESAFGEYLKENAASLNTKQFDVIALGFGGLIARTYLSGYYTPCLTLPGIPSYDQPLCFGYPFNDPSLIRKLVLIGSPNFGGYIGLTCTSACGSLEQTISNDQIQHYSYPLLHYGYFSETANGWLVAINTWNQQGDDLRGVDTIAIAGKVFEPYYSPRTSNTDGIVPIGSASIGFTDSASNQRTRILNGYCHDNFALHASLCPNGLGAIANITGPTHPSYKIIRSFLDGSDTWKTIGTPDNTDSIWKTLDSPSGNRPKINRYGIRTAAGTPPGPLSVSHDSLVTIYGQNLSSTTTSAPFPWPTKLGDTVVTMAGIECQLSYVSPTQVNALVPAQLWGGGAGLVDVVVYTSLGQSVNTDTEKFKLMIDIAAPALFAMNGNSAAALHATSYQIISDNNPAAPGEYIALYGTGFGIAGKSMSAFIDGQPATVTWAGRSPGYKGLDQINVQVPEGTHRKMSVPVTVTVVPKPIPPCVSSVIACPAISRTSNTVLLPIN
jgi:uncharacterized protein (TIGR03437 family)